MDRRDYIMLSIARVGHTAGRGACARLFGRAGHHGFGGDPQASNRGRVSQRGAVPLAGPLTPK